jgi:hypothetical protein
MYDKNSILPELNCALATSVPDHLMGTRAALFHMLIKRSDDNISVANTVVPSSTPAYPKPTEKRFDWRNVLPEDNFVFRSA